MEYKEEIEENAYQYNSNGNAWNNGNESNNEPIKVSKAVQKTNNVSKAVQETNHKSKAVQEKLIRNIQNINREIIKINEEIKNSHVMRFNAESTTFRRYMQNKDEKKNKLIKQKEKLLNSLTKVSSELSRKESINALGELNYNAIRRKELNNLYRDHHQKSINIEGKNKGLYNINEQRDEEIKRLLNTYNKRSFGFKSRENKITNLSLKEKNVITRNREKLIKEREKIHEMMKSIISNENITTLLSTGNSRGLKIKKNELREELYKYIKIFNDKTENLQRIMTKIRTIIRSNQLNTETKEKEKISMINDLERLVTDYNSLVTSSDATQLTQNLELFLSKEQIKNKEYQSLINIRDLYKEELQGSYHNILEVLVESLEIRTLYVNRINEYIQNLYENIELYMMAMEGMEGIDVINLLRRSREIINDMLRIKGFRNISLSDEIQDTIENLNTTFRNYEIEQGIR